MAVRCGGRSGSDAFPLVGDVIHDDVISHLIGGGVKNSAGVEPRQLIDKTLPVEIGSEHESVDFDPALGAALHFLQRLVNDSAMQ